MTELESRFTEPSDWCPRPERWHSADSDSTEVEVSELVGSFIRALQPEMVVETGTAWGQTAQAIGHALARNGHGRLVTHEPDPERAAHCAHLLRGLPVVVNCGSSLDWTPSTPIDFAWFDSLFSLRVAEFRRYRQWLKPGSIVGFHDTAPHHKKQLPLHELEGEGLLRAIRLHTPRGVTFGEVQ